MIMNRTPYGKALDRSGSVAASPWTAIARPVLRAFSPGGSHGLSILIFHRVLPQKDELFPSEVDAHEFDAQLTLVKSLFNVIPLIDAVRLTRSGKLPPRAACITFDDGYADNAEVALPLLQQHSLSATFFIATGFLDGGRMWNDSVIELIRRTAGEQFDARSLGLGLHAVDSVKARRQAIAGLIGQLKYLPFDARLAKVAQLLELSEVILPNNLMMTSHQVRQLRDAGMGIGAHTITHPILATLDATAARAEIGNGKSALEAIVGQPVPLFAYPNGKPGTDYLAEHVAIAKELGFEGAVSTAWGAARRPDLYQLPRFTPWDRQPWRYALRMARNMTVQAQQT